ncbi:ATP-binding protein [Pseudorhodobacter sp. W20_MBD10_FR17]|uniref:ATP-binding protein n=1 Tax=Pseudorhodobacter sp. W20_MBD10_FR17 TaxID=3240266 RepID=UPI003F9C165A
MKQKSPRSGSSLWIWAVLGVIGAAVIAVTSANVVRDLRLLNSARSDNVQWTLSQAEVEFLEYRLDLERAIHSPDPDLKSLRREFDIFYSRMETLRVASIYAPLRKLAGFSLPLAELQVFLFDSVDFLDADDETLIAALPDLLVLAENAETRARTLSNSGLSFFADASDRMREKVALTLMQMAASVAFLIVVLLILALYQGRLNRQNIRRRKEAIEASERMNVVISTALDGVIVADERWRIVEFNAAAQQIFGYSAAQAIGKTVSQLIVPDHLVADYEGNMRRDVAATEKQIIGKGRIKLEAKRADGSVFPVEVSLQAATTEGGEVYIAFLRDISHRVRAEAELVAALDRALAGEKAKTDFLATMSHEIRTPLNGLLGNLSLLEDTQPTEQQNRYIKNMEISGKLLMSHISDVLDITKYDAGKLTLRPVDMNLSTLLQDIVDNQSGAAVARNTVLNWAWAGTPVEWIRADRDHIQHVLMNVIGNAVKFTHGGKINVTLQAGDDLEIVVRDTGIGMDAALQARIFDDFVTGDSSYGRDVGGTGLGLGLAKRYINALGGTISVESAPGAGSVFRIRFPIKPIAPPTKTKGHDAPIQDAISRSVLLVEDNEINRVVAREMLRAAGHTVVEAHNGREAVTLAQNQAFDLILMDISMPVLDGRSATREIRAGQGLCAQVPIVALTANAMAEEQEAYLADGMNDVLTKPLSRAALLRVVSTLEAPQNPVATPAATTSALDDLRDMLGAKALQQLLVRFKNDIEQTITVLTAETAQSPVEMESLVHKGAGSAAYFGLVDLRQALLAIETAAKNQDHAAIQAAIAALPQVWDAALQMLPAEGDG